MSILRWLTLAVLSVGVPVAQAATRTSALIYSALAT